MTPIGVGVDINLKNLLFWFRLKYLQKEAFSRTGHYQQLLHFKQAIMKGQHRKTIDFYSKSALLG